MMILIQSSANDETTNDVLDWIYYLNGSGQEVVRHNDLSFIEKISLTINEGTALAFSCPNSGTEVSNRAKRWYRRGIYKLIRRPLPAEAPGADLASKLNTILANDEQAVLNGLDRVFNSINRFADNKTDKIEMLQLAAGQHLSIPETLVSNDPDEIVQFIDRYEKVITKAIYNNSFSFRYEEAEIIFSLPTKIVTRKDAAAMGQQGMPVLLQQYIEKKFELRIFYFNGLFYPMAIFSQANESTKIDFRNYDDNRPNRCVPYKLPEGLTMQLDAFMRSAGLNCGSIDMIYTPEGKYVFLEVNPVGQFQWLSKNCNYDIERQIAKYLLENNITNGKTG